MICRVCGRTQLYPTLWDPTVCQASLSMEFSKQEHWGGLLFPTPGDLPDLRIKLVKLSVEEMCMRVRSCQLSDSATPWTVAQQAPLSCGSPGKILEQVAVSYSRGSSGSFTTSATWEVHFFATPWRLLPWRCRSWLTTLQLWGGGDLACGPRFSPGGQTVARGQVLALRCQEGWPVMRQLSLSTSGFSLRKSIEGAHLRLIL